MALYEVVSSIAFVMDKPFVMSGLLGTLAKGDLIDVIDVNNDWAYLKYNNNNAYVSMYSLNGLFAKTGSVIISYIDTTSLADVAPSTIHTNLAMGSYTFTAEEIPGYILEGMDTQTITLTDDNPDQTIFFTYEKILASVTIKYIDNTTYNDIISPVIINNLSLGNHSYNTIFIPGYMPLQPVTQTLTLTSDNPNQLLIFKYEQIVGSITIRYIDESTLLDIYEPMIIKNLPIVNYSYSAINIPGYTLSGDLSQRITLTSVNPEQTITFTYSKMVGSVTVKYVDNLTLANLSLPITIKNLDLSTHSYDSILINGYNLISETPQIADLTISNPNQTLTFIYEKY